MTLLHIVKLTYKTNYAYSEGVSPFFGTFYSVFYCTFHFFTNTYDFINKPETCFSFKQCFNRNTVKAYDEIINKLIQGYDEINNRFKRS